MWNVTLGNFERVCIYEMKILPNGLDPEQSNSWHQFERKKEKTLH